MKVNFDIKNEEVAIRTLRVGDSFLADRKSMKETGLYMIVDKNSGLIKADFGNIIAANLVSGQLRRFDSNTIVEPVKAEVNLKK